MLDLTTLFMKRCLLFFWAIWLTVVFASNLCDGAKYLGLLGPDWKFASGNYDFLVQTTARYHPPDWLNGLLFVGVLCWEGTTAALFWLAWGTFRGQRWNSSAAVTVAFTAALALWATFAIACEVCIAYPVEATHWRLFIAQLATLLAIKLLPDRMPEGQ